jgi:hypothetical protein
MEWRQIVLAPTATTATHTHGPVAVTETGHNLVALEFIVEVTGGTPTVTCKLQGGFDGTNFMDVFILPGNIDTAVATFTQTAVGCYIYFVAQKHTRGYPQYQIVTSANTNITYRANLWIGQAQ